jgi:hypothetical protein
LTSQEIAMPHSDKSVATDGPKGSGVQTPFERGDPGTPGQTRYTGSGPQSGFSQFESGGVEGSGSYRHDAFDPDYQRWREHQMRVMDDDYRTWLDQGHDTFSEEFGLWRDQRRSAATGNEAPSMESSTPGTDALLAASGKPG